MDAKNAMHILQNLANNATCEELHHKKAHQHAFRLPCPVVEEIQQAAGIVSKRIAELDRIAKAAVVWANSPAWRTENTALVEVEQNIVDVLRAAGYLGAGDE